MKKSRFVIVVAVLAVLLFGALLYFMFSSQKTNVLSEEQEKARKQSPVQGTMDIRTPNVGSTFTFVSNQLSIEKNKRNAVKDTTYFEVLAKGVQRFGKEDVLLVGIHHKNDPKHIDTLYYSYELNGDFAIYREYQQLWVPYPTASGKDRETIYQSPKQDTMSTVTKITTGLDAYDTLTIAQKRVPCIRLKHIELSSTKIPSGFEITSSQNGAVWYAPSLGIIVRSQGETSTQSVFGASYLRFLEALDAYEMK